MAWVTTPIFSKPERTPCSSGDEMSANLFRKKRKKRKKNNARETLSPVSFIEGPSAMPIPLYWGPCTINHATSMVQLRDLWRRRNRVTSNRDCVTPPPNKLPHRPLYLSPISLIPPLASPYSVLTHATVDFPGRGSFCMQIANTSRPSSSSKRRPSNFLRRKKL